MSQPKILIAAGGTGGHIYPALAMAEAFRARQAHVEFVGTPYGLESQIIPTKGYPLHHIHVGRLNSNVSLWERLRTLIQLPWSMIESVRLLRKYQPDFVLGVGGFATGPVLLMSSLLGYRCAIWEPNAIPGLANRWLSRFVNECWVVFEDARRYLHSAHLHRAGMPVRHEIESASGVPSSSAQFRVLVFGGSQGARGVNTAVMEMLKSFDWNGFRFVHQTGRLDFERLQKGYSEKALSVDLELQEYLHDMPRRYAEADLVVCRAGTGTLSELAACGKAAILIPFPFAADNHQQKNAESLVTQGAAVMLLQKDLTPQRLRDEILQLKSAPDRRQKMAAAIRQFHQPQAAQKLVDEFLERIR